MDWVVFALWAVIGLMNLCVPVPVTKWEYGFIWFVLMVELLLNALEKVV